VCCIPCGCTKFSQLVRARARVSSDLVVILLLTLPNLTSHPPLCLRAIEPRVRAPMGDVGGGSGSAPGAGAGRLLLGGGTRGWLLRRTGTASSRCSLAPASAASWARCCCRTSPAPPSWPHAGPSAGTL